MIFGHYLTVQPWTPSFRSHNHVVSQVIGWIRLPKLPARYYHKSIIRSIGGVFGEVIKVDYNTDSGDCGKFARIAVIIDLTKPLVSKIMVDGELIFVEYEGLPSICYDCGMYGHLQASCPAKTTLISGGKPDSSANGVTNAPIPVQPERETSDFGAWMQVQRRRRTYDRGGKTNSASGDKKVVNGSRYEVLGDVIEEEKHQASEYSPDNFSLNNEIIPRNAKVNGKKGQKKSDTGIKQKEITLQGKKQESLPNSQGYVAKHTNTSLDPNSNSVVRIDDPRHSRMKQTDKGIKDGPSNSRAQPTNTNGNDARARARGTKISSGVSIQHLGAKPNSDGAEPSIRSMKEFAKGPSSDHFKFLAPWLTHPEFQEIIKRIWSSGTDLLSCIDSFKEEIQRWNSETFGGIGHRKRRLFRRLNGIQRKIELHPDVHHGFLIDLETSLREDLENVCFQEELLWLQKSTSDWVCLGDRNTSFYHLKALMRRKHNHVSQLKLSDGSWLSNEDQLSNFARQFFSNLYSLEDPNFTPLSLHGAFSKLKNHHLLWMERSLTIDEIHHSLFEMKPLKSPGHRIGPSRDRP
ncbi:hypothetical protein K1719_043425 [Acacia pycnantha]|nr:hypothetical protein K1719_043425 [Acacia pycnantha]